MYGTASVVMTQPPQSTVLVEVCAALVMMQPNFIVEVRVVVQDAEAEAEEEEAYDELGVGSGRGSMTMAVVSVVVSRVRREVVRRILSAGLWCSEVNALWSWIFDVMGLTSLYFGES